jgi:biotin carboxylase
MVDSLVAAGVRSGLREALAGQGINDFLASLGLGQSDVPAPRGFAMQLRINMETMTEDGSAKPGGGTLTVFEPPSGPGVRVDTYGYAGYRTNPNFDSLLAKGGSARREVATKLATDLGGLG